MKIGILGAMPEEISSIKDLMTDTREVVVGNRVFIEGYIRDREVVLVFSRWGKVAASSTTTALIQKFNVHSIIFTGVAGAVHSKLNIGDIVIGNGLYQHDMDARPMFNQYQIPLTDTIIFRPNGDNVQEALTASEKFVAHIMQYLDETTLTKHSIFKPAIYQGLIASGDKFITDVANYSDLNHRDEMNNETLAVEMEGAAVAQVCEEYGIPYVVVRTISDKANHSASVDFQSFIANIANKYSAGIINNYL